MSTTIDFTPPLTALFRTVLQASWQGALAIVLVMLVRQALGARVPARWHYLLWFLVLVRLLVPTSMLPHSPASLENIPAVAQPFNRQQLPATGRKAQDNLTVVMPLPLPASPQVTAPKSAVAAAPGTISRPWSWQTFAALTWLAGAISLGFWLVVCSLTLRRRVRRETFPAEAELAALWQMCCRRWLRRPAPPVLTAAWVHSPALVGTWRPTLLLPRQAPDSFSTQDWEHVFAHEIAHLRWHDHWSQLVLLAAWCLHWFNPVVWLGLRRLRADRELAADEWALQHLAGDRALAYGETLFKTLADRPAGFSFQPIMVGISEDGAQMKQRLRRITIFLPRRRLLGSLVGLCIGLMLAAVVLGQGISEPAGRSTAKAAQRPEYKPVASPTPEETPTISVETMMADMHVLADDLLAAARAGDAVKIRGLIVNSYTPPFPAKFSQVKATELLDGLIRSRELVAFTTLLDQFKQSSYGMDWKVSDELLASLVRAGCTDFLDALLARRLELDRLAKLVPGADPATSQWIMRRVAEVTKQRADLELLEKAAADGDLSAIHRWLDAGVDVNGVGKDDNTPLLRAVFDNRLEAAQLLLDRGALVDEPRFRGWNYTPLCLVNSVPMAELLRRNGASLFARRWQRDVSLLFYVAKHAKAEVVAWFLKQGLDPKMVGGQNENLLFEVANAQTAKLLLDAGVDPNQVSTFRGPPICTARDAEIAQLLIERGARVTGFDKPLLPYMLQFGSAGAVEVVLKAQGTPDHAVIQRSLLDAAFIDKAEIAKVLLKNGANPNEAVRWSGDEPGNTTLPLLACTINPCPETARVLIAAGADPNAGDPPGIILRNALGNNHQEVITILREAGARGVGDLAYWVARQREENIMPMLVSAPTYQDNPAFWDDALPTAARVGNVLVVRAALDKGVPPRPSDSSDAYAYAARDGQDEALAILLAARKSGESPTDLYQALYEAVWNSHPYQTQRGVEHFEKCAQMLLQAGAPADGKGIEGADHLLAAAVFTRNPGGNPAVMEMLVRAGVNPNPPYSRQVNGPKGSLLDAMREAYAEGNCSVEVAETLLRLNHLSTAPAVVGPAATLAPAPPPQPGNPPATPAQKSRQKPVDTAQVSMLDGTPLSGEPITARIAKISGLSGTSEETQPVRDHSFYLHFDADTTSATVAVEQPGCAPVYIGPFDKANLYKFDHLQVKLTRGFAGTIQMADEAGQPVANARLRSYYPGPPVVSLADAFSDASGNVVIDHLADAPVNIRVLAAGFQADEVTALRLDPTKPYRWTLKPTRQLPGTVVSAVTGKPVAGAVIKLAGVRGGPNEESCYDPKKATVLTTTDAQGCFVLGSLRSDSRYYFFVEAPGQGGVYLRGVKLDQKQLTVTLGPELTIQGKIIHIPPSVVHTGKVYLQYGQTFDIGENYSGVASDSADLAPVNGEATFIVGPFYKVFDASTSEPKGPDLWDGKAVGIYVDHWGLANFSPNELPVSNFVFDLAKQSNPRDPALSEKESASIEKASNATPVSEPAKADQPSSAAQAPSPVKQNTVSLPGIVTDAATGRPIGGAAIKLAGTENLQVPSMMHIGPSAAATLATTDKQGHFNLENLRADIRYWFFVEATGYGGAYLALPTLPANGLQVKLGPERFIRGRIVHAPASMIHDGKLSLSFNQELLKTPGEEIWTTLVLEPKNGEADFIAGPLYQPQGVHPFNKAPVTLRIDGKAQAYFRAEELPKADYVLNLAPNLGHLDGEYKTEPTSPWTLDLRKDGMAYYFSSDSRYTARYEVIGDEVTFTFPDGAQDHLQVNGSELLGSSEPNTLWPVARFKKQ